MGRSACSGNRHDGLIPFENCHCSSEIASIEVHDEVECATAASVFPGIPELCARKKQFEIQAANSGVPASTGRILSRGIRAIALGVVGERDQNHLSIKGSPPVELYAADWPHLQSRTESLAGLSRQPVAGRKG